MGHVGRTRDGGAALGARATPPHDVDAAEPRIVYPRCHGRVLLTCSIVAKGQSEADKLAELVVAVAKRANSAEEPGTKTVRSRCTDHQYRVTREANVGLEIVVFEEYESAEALAAHQAAPEFQALAKATPELTSKFDMNFYHQLYPTS